MPRNRTARLAVLGSSVQRSPSAPYSSRTSSALRRRVVAGALIALSLALITIYFRESDAGPLHGVQGVGATVLRPFEVGAGRVARPFRDTYGYFKGLVNAKSENGRLRREVETLRQQVIQNETALQENVQLRGLLAYRESPEFPKDYRAVAASVLARAPSQFEQQIVVSAGSSSGIRLHDPVVTGHGLVGQVTRVTSSGAQVTLLTDATSAVSAVDLHTNAAGVVRHGTAGSDSLILDRVTKDLVVNRGDPVITAGWKQGRLSSIYPKGIPIGTVTSVGQLDTDLFKQVQVEPLVDFSLLDSVLVLVPTKPVPQLP